MPEAHQRERRVFQIHDHPVRWHTAQPCQRREPCATGTEHPGGGDAERVTYRKDRVVAGDTEGGVRRIDAEGRGNLLRRMGRFRAVDAV